MASNVWGQTTPAPATSFADVMSEQLIEKLSKDETTPDASSSSQTLPSNETTTSDTGTDNVVDDFRLAQMLQYEYDLEHDLQLRAREKCYSKDNGKMSISYKNYLILPMDTNAPRLIDSTDEEDELEDSIWYQEPKVNLGPAGYKEVNGEIITKHDEDMCDTQNAERLMQMSNFNTGYLETKLSNRVFNDMKVYSKHAAKSTARVKEHKDHSTTLEAVDNKTKLILHKLINKGLLESVDGVVNTGKEAVILRGIGGCIEEFQLPENVILKVYKTTLLDFKNREQYLKGDKRFVKDSFKKLNPRKVIRWWSQKEVANLVRMKKANMSCPEVFALKQHVLVMSMIGGDTPAKKLHEVKTDETTLASMYDQCVDNLRRLYKDCELVHSDYSTYNLLWHEGKVHVIDVGQAVDISHPQAFRFLYRDCGNISRHFSEGKHALSDVMSPQRMFAFVTGLGVDGEDSADPHVGGLDVDLVEEEFLCQTNLCHSKTRMKPTAITTGEGDFVHPDDVNDI